MSNDNIDYGTEIGKHSFLPWIRRGVSIHVSRADDDATPSPRAMLNVGVTIGPGPSSNPAAPEVVPLALYGPGDIHSLDQMVVVRSWPQPDVFQAEPNYFPLLELQPADLPWRFTPSRATSKDRLRPWLVLIALRDDEIAPSGAPTTDKPFIIVTVKSAASLPPLDQAWAWAHVQVTGESTVDEATALELLDHEPHRIVARLLCPRRLDPNTAYTCFLVPGLERARLAGLGQTVQDTVDGLAPAWSPGGTNIQLPVHYSWRFMTGDAGDFASLIRQVQARPMPATVGSRPMDETNPGLALPAASPTPLNAEAALRALGSNSTPWAVGDKSAWTSAIESVLNRPADLLAAPGGERVIAPPLYGRWYAGSDRLNSSPTSDAWFADLNFDPRMRTSAGVGTLVVQTDQQKYLASAWVQVAGIRATNAALKAAQLAREAALRLYTRHLVVRSDISVVTSSAPLHARILTSPHTVSSVVGLSPLSAGLLNSAWRRLTRPRGPLGTRLARAGQTAGATILERVNSGAVRVAPPPPIPAVLATFSRAGQSLAPSWLTPALLANMAHLLHLSLLVWIVILLAAVLLFMLGGGAIALLLLAVAAGIQLFGPAILASTSAQVLGNSVALRAGTLSEGQITSAPMRPAFVPAEFTLGTPLAAVPVLATGAVEQPSAARFRSAAAAMFAAYQTPVVEGPVLQSVDFNFLRTKIVTGLDPAVTIAATFRQRLALAPGLVWQFPDPLEPVMAAPSFNDAMYSPLYQLSCDWLLPGLDQVPQDTVSLVRTNERFVDSYMVGVNHEMARTLFFNEYPTDQRGTYFRQFWDSSSVPNMPGHPVNPETRKDIKPIDTWGAASKLGANSSRQKPSGGDYLVILLRAEVLRRYPHLVVYATRAKWKSDGTHDVDDSTESQPVFSGRLGSGVGFWGFDLTTDQVKGGPRITDDPGWFFMLQEAPTESRHGLEPAKNYGGQSVDWPSLSWGHLAIDKAALDDISFVDLNAVLPDTSVVSDSNLASWHADSGKGKTGARASDIAYITYRVPVRVAVHAKTMIPEGV